MVGLQGQAYLGMNEVLMGTALKSSPAPNESRAPSTVGGDMWRGFVAGGVPSAVSYAYAGLEVPCELPSPDQLTASGGVDPISELGLVQGRAELPADRGIHDASRPGCIVTAALAVAPGPN